MKNYYSKVRTMADFLRTVLFSLLFISASFCLTGCDGSDDGPGDGSLYVTGVTVPGTINGKVGDKIVLNGQGIGNGDRIRFVNTVTPSVSYYSSVSLLDATSFQFELPAGISTGEYMLYVVRGAESRGLGMAIVNIFAEEVPDAEGKNIKGRVSCEGSGVEGVVVSDGYEVTKTDSQGVYYLTSTKKSGYVFISVPANYEVPNLGVFPQFFKRLGSDVETVEQKDFDLTRVNNERHQIYTLADMHLANRNDDLKQFERVVSDIKAYIGANSDQRVYGLTLGDMVWDEYWLSRSYGFSEYVKTMNTSGIPGAIFHVMGNHDNDPYCYGDWAGEQKYKEFIGPTYYSFNLGKVHYVVLDDTEYVNNGGATSSMGDLSYKGAVVADQVQWLAKDLEHVADDTPVVVAMHIQFHRHPVTLDSEGNNVVNQNISNASEIVSLLSRFKNVHILSAHTHMKFNAEAAENLYEHNIAAICATWWWTGKTGYAGNHICREGTPGGYQVFEMDGDRIEWYYKGIGLSREYQFRTYDLNECLVTAEKYAPGANSVYSQKVAEYAGPYVTENRNNEVLINIWDYDSKWKIEVTENGNPLDVTRVIALDPLHIISYDMLRLNVNATPTNGFFTFRTTHMFKVQARSATSTLEIKVTDRFSNVFTESMKRPKALSLSMK